jgi:hypothetical protein
MTSFVASKMGLSLRFGVRFFSEATLKIKRLAELLNISQQFIAEFGQLGAG